MHKNNNTLRGCGGGYYIDNKLTPDSGQDKIRCLKGSDSIIGYYVKFLWKEIFSIEYQHTRFISYAKNK